MQRALKDGLCVRLAVPRLECMPRLECTAGNSSGVVFKGKGKNKGRRKK